MSEQFDFKALEKQLREIINISESTEQREAAEKALHMLPKYKHIDIIVENIRNELINAYNFSIESYNEAQRVSTELGGIHSHVPSGRRTITIDLIGRA